MKNSKAWYLLGVLLTLLVLLNLILWWYLRTKPLPFGEIKALYMDYFPEWVNNARYLTGFFVLINILALAFLGKAIAYLGKNYLRVGHAPAFLDGFDRPPQSFVHHQKRDKGQPTANPDARNDEQNKAEYHQHT